MPSRRQEALDYHAQGRPGKIQVSPTKPFKNQRDLSLACTPGVAEPCREIAERPDEVYSYPAKSNLVAVVTNGTAVLGLGNIGPLAAKPVMEGKGILFKAFADIDVFDLEVGSERPDDVIRFCQLLEPTVGGINLEDIRSPDCFYIEETLRATLSIPVFHDDQHGTAIISGAALLNALELLKKEIAQIKVVFALANPTPEIMPDEARAARPDALIATGRSDFPNQVNNVLGFPFIFRGALDVRAKQINEEMEMAATRALASLAREEVPESVMRAYGLERLRFGPDYLIPKPFDPRVLLWVAPAVAWAAIGSGVAGRVIDVEECRAQLDARLGKAREVMRGLSTRAQQQAQRIVFPEGEDARILRAARVLADDGIGEPILLGDPDMIRRQADDAGVTLEDIALASPRAGARPDAPRPHDAARRAGRRGGGGGRDVLPRRDPARARSDRRGAGPAPRQRHLHARVSAADVLLRGLHGQHRSGRGDARGDRLGDGQLRVAARDRAAGRDALVLELRLGEASRRRQGAARRRAAARARARAAGGRRDAGRHRRGGADPDQGLPVREAAERGERADLPRPRRREYRLQAAEPDRGRRGDRPDPRGDGAARPHPAAGRRGERHRQHGRDRGGGRAGARPPPADLSPAAPRAR